mmetsp:Transcript_120594/g.257541  ORF Transcript_120594/g.257541 Transcript_120594/m.257541 type:complete len:241 (-) Transcript_120594:56-778(-)
MERGGLSSSQRLAGGPNPYRLPAPQNFTSHLAGNVAHGDVYDWMKPVIKVDWRHAMDTEGPVRRINPRKGGGGSAGDLPPLVAGSGPSPPRQKPGLVSRGKRPRTDIWPVGTTGPNWSDKVTPQEHMRRVTAASAVRAAAGAGRSRAAKSGRLSHSASCPGKLSEQGFVGETPGVEAWDSISQAPSDGEDEYSEVESAVTATRTGMRRQPPKGPLDRIIEEHITRNRGGWYDHVGGRLLG